MTMTELHDHSTLIDSENAWQSYTEYFGSTMRAQRDRSILIDTNALDNRIQKCLGRRRECNAIVLLIDAKALYAAINTRITGILGQP